MSDKIESKLMRFQTFLVVVAITIIVGYELWLWILPLTLHRFKAYKHPHWCIPPCNPETDSKGRTCHRS